MSGFERIRYAQRLISVLVPSRLDSVIFKPLVKTPIAAREVVMHLPLAEAIIIQIIEAGIGQPGIKRSEIREIERVVGSVIDAGEESDQTTRLPRRGIVADGSFDYLKRFLRPVHDRLGVVLEHFSPGEPFAAGDFAPGHIQFTCLRLVTNRHLQRYLGRF